MNSRLTDLPIRPGSYLELRRDWRAGDVVDLDFAMPPQMMAANPLVEEDLNQVAIKRGPLVYCLESTDLPRGVRFQNVLLPENLDLVARYDQRLLGGTVVVEGAALARSAGDSDGTLYREFHPAPLRPANIRLIPYYAWGNRGASEMSVWIPVGTPNPARPARP